jgi:hypothetical protein
MIKESLFWLELLRKNIFLFVFETFKPSLYIIKITNKNVPHNKSWLKVTQILKGQGVLKSGMPMGSFIFLSPLSPPPFMTSIGYHEKKRKILLVPPHQVMPCSFGLYPLFM